MQLAFTDHILTEKKKNARYKFNYFTPKCNIIFNQICGNLIFLQSLLTS